MSIEEQQSLQNSDFISLRELLTGICVCHKNWNLREAANRLTEFPEYPYLPGMCERSVGGNITAEGPRRSKISNAIHFVADCGEFGNVWTPDQPKPEDYDRFGFTRSKFLPLLAQRGIYLTTSEPQSAHEILVAGESYFISVDEVLRRICVAVADCNHAQAATLLYRRFYVQHSKPGWVVRDKLNGVQRATRLDDDSARLYLQSAAGISDKGTVLLQFVGRVVTQQTGTPSVELGFYPDVIFRMLREGEPSIDIEHVQPVPEATPSETHVVESPDAEPANARLVAAISEQTTLWARREPAHLFAGTGFSEEALKLTTLSRYLDYDTWTSAAAAMLVCGLQAPIVDGELCTEIPESGAMGLDNCFIMGYQDPFHEGRRVLGIWRSQANPPARVRPLDFISWCKSRGIDTSWLRSIEDSRLEAMGSDMKASLGSGEVAVPNNPQFFAAISGNVKSDAAAPQAPTADNSHKPDWGVWSNALKATLWDSICLSCDTDPKAVPREVAAHLAAKMFPEIAASKGVRIEISRRLDIAKSHAGTGGTLPTVSGGRDDNADVYLATFAAWALHRMKWTIPDELRALVDKVLASRPVTSPEAATGQTLVPGEQEQTGRPSGGDWEGRAREIAQEIGERKWRTGIREITARGICEAVATELGKDPRYHGNRGPRSSSNIRSEALKGWRFTPPIDVA